MKYDFKKFLKCMVGKPILKIHIQSMSLKTTLQFKHNTRLTRIILNLNDTYGTITKKN